MTTDEYIKKIEYQIEQIEKFDKPLELAVRSIMALQSKRIFIDAKNSDEGIIGEYKDGEIYVNPKDSPVKFQTKGKEGKSVFDNGKAHKTGYFKSYLGFKTSIGRNKNNKTVDLFLTGDLHRNWANAEFKEAPSAIKINQHNYIVALSDLNMKKVERYGRVFNLSVREKGFFLSIITRQLGKLLK